MHCDQALTVAAVGDIMLGEGVHRIHRGVRSAWRGKQAGELLADLRPTLESADICIGNLECMLGPINSSNPRQMIYKGEEMHLNGLRAAGFSHLSLANNHILEQGLEIAEQTKAAVTRAGLVACCGRNPVRTVHCGLSVDLFTYNLIHDTPHHGFYRDEVADADLEQIRRSDAQLKIVCIHWGDEYSRYPSPQQIELGHRLVDAGAKLVLGHHPHVTQGIEQRAGALIAYSLGNFVFDMNWSEATRRSFVLKARVPLHGPGTFEKIAVRQDDQFVPSRVDLDCEQPENIDTAVLRFSNEPQTYVAYKNNVLKRSRARALASLGSQFYSVHPKTWQGLFLKKLARVQNLLGK